LLAQRLITATVGIPVILGVVLLGGVAYTLVAAAILALAAHEFVVMLTPRDDMLAGSSLASATGIAAVAGVALITVAADTGFDEWSGAIVASLGFVFLAALVSAPGPDGLARWTAAAAALIYVGVLGSYLVLLRGLPDGVDWILLAVLATWGTDTFAYFVGKAIGRNKMAPRISPGKTWEGTVGGLIGGLATVVALNVPLDLPMSTGEALLLGLLLPAVSVAADLGESMLKRGAGVKDTSALIPGHGGFLDRLDSILFTVPLVYYFAIWAVI
jgi:phosphatidate cytidylyltransferase